ncbi:MAG: hypothetical protein ACREPA_01705 [Candidatus Dormibacteraceae bacterium]
MNRYFETLFRYRGRFAFVFVVLPLVLGAGTIVAFRNYGASANLWVDAPTFYGSSATPADWNQYATPAQNEKDSLDQMLATQAFVDTVGQQLQKSGAVTSQKELQPILASLPTALKTTATGSHLLSLSFSCSEKNVCPAVLTATIAAFQSQSVDLQRNAQQLGIAFLQSQVTKDQTVLRQAHQALDAYLSQHRDIQITAGAQTGDPRANQLNQAVIDAQAQLTQVQSQLAQETFLGSAVSSYFQSSTAVVDPPHVSKGGMLGDRSSLKRAAVTVAVCLAAGFAYLLALVWLDGTIRDPRELERQLGVPVVATIPRLPALERAQRA